MPGDTQPAADLLAALSQLIRTARSVTHRQIGQFGPSGTPMGLLKALHTGDARASDLACRLGIAPSVVSRAIVPLEDDGLIERKPDPRDARAWLIGLTPSGRQELARIQQEYTQRLTDVLARWDDEEVAAAAALLQRLERAISEGIAQMPPVLPPSGSVTPPQSTPLVPTPSVTAR